MPYSDIRYDSYIINHMGDTSEMSILDVGAGAGKYNELLKGKYKRMDALEIFERYIHDFDLVSKYTNVYVGDIVKFDFDTYDYDIVIMGDILEHLSVEDAQTVIQKLSQKNIRLYVQVPYMYEQGEHYGNVYETHLQPTLTHELMQQLYPQLTTLCTDSQMGLYYADFRGIVGCFSDEYIEITKRLVSYIETKEHPFVVSRYGDGEMMLMQGKPVGMGSQAQVMDKWTSSGQSLLGQDLLHTLSHQANDFIYAIPCQCCNKEAKRRYIERIQSKMLTYANIFINGNWQKFQDTLELIKNKKQDVVFIANHLGQEKYKDWGFNTVDYYPIQDDCVTRYEINKGLLIDSLRKYTDTKDTVFLVSAGPLANIIVDFLYRLNPHNVYLDVGSAIDFMIKGTHTRGYMNEGSPYYARKCVF